MDRTAFKKILLWKSFLEWRKNMGIYEELSVRKVINCMGPYTNTKVGESLMPVV